MRPALNPWFRWPLALISSFASLLAALLLFFAPPSGALSALSFDLPFLLRPAPPRFDDLVLLYLNEQTYRDLGQVYPAFDRSIHARLLEKLNADGARLAVFDMTFPDPRPSDPIFARAITNFGKVVLGADLDFIDHPILPGTQPVLPNAVLADLPGCSIGLVGVDPGLIVRSFPRPNDRIPGLAAAAAQALGHKQFPPPFITQWINFYGRTGTLPTFSYKFALDAGPGFFHNKIVFIGGGPKTDHANREKDMFGTPYSRWQPELTSGLEIQATMFLNLVRDETLVRARPLPELSAALAAALLFGVTLSLFRPAPGFAIAIIGVLATSAASITLVWTARVWIDWTPIAFVQIPVAWASAAVLYSTQLNRRAANPPLQTAPALAPENVPTRVGVFIRDFQLLKKIGEGAYGEVWLARAITGTFRALKIIYRDRFADERPFQREFEGVKNFEPISRNHHGWVHILYVGKDEPARHFYYVMEPADDLHLGAAIDPENYTPKSLDQVLTHRGPLPLPECLDLGIHLADALFALHQLGLIHRDVKPSNIIFISGRAKLADIGLVAQVGKFSTFVGTVGYIPPEGPGTVGADLFSLGKVLFQCATGLPPNADPVLPPGAPPHHPPDQWAAFSALIHRACAPLASDRFSSAEEMKRALALLRDRHASVTSNSAASGAPAG